MDALHLMLEEEGEAYDLSLSGLSFSSEDFSGSIITDSLFSSCSFSSSSFRDASLSSVTFDSCDLSSADFSLCSIHRVAFRDCRLTGASFARSRIRELAIAGTSAIYVTFDESSIKKLRITSSDLSDSSFSECRADDAVIRDTLLCRTSFRGTMLSLFVLSGSDIEGIILSENIRELRGACLDVAQGLAVARTLGADIK